MRKFDIVIIGGGASGLAAAVEAGRAGGRRIAVLEKLDRVGKKLLVTGNGRCNLTNRNIAPESYNTPAAMSVLAGYGDSEEFFRTLGVLTSADGEGRVYPMSNAASAVLDALRFECERLGVEFICGQRVTDVKKTKNGFEITSEAGSINAEKVILSAGGRAAPKCGTEGDAYAIAEKLGISVVKPAPALVPLKTDTDAARTLKGVRASGQVRAKYPDGSEKVRRGEVQFGDGTVSGICVFDLAYPLPKEVSVDFLPDMEQSEAAETVEQLIALRSGRAAEDALTGIVNKRVAAAVIKSKLNISPATPAGEILPWQCAAIAGGLKNLRFDITGSAGWDNAQVTAGGVPLDALDENLQSLKVEGLYVTGEAVNVHGDCGGFNLAWAWASGRCAGANAAKGE